ncbi:MAG TPA: tRNA (adenosine(37)-N6)-threonylcarbamoyltransferase complex dimerization subunit type 1 TsaB [Thermoanaerobaculia bacterium]|nr:tRNA (adenosine(37)-N6)-threonylcarbamoyltransferase complex dimerization subunit type 1 TsaB [Thermoanaerobaculia bacterium]
MNVLALDTAGPLPAVAVAAGGAVFEKELPAERQASEKLLGAIQDTLTRAGLSLADCDRIAVCSGPGSFTGLRVGLSTAWGLGRALGIPVEEVSTLEVLAEAARKPGLTAVTTVLDAGRGEVIAASFSLAGPRARSADSPVRIPTEQAAALSAPLFDLPGGLLGGAGKAPAISLARALALAVAGSPREDAGSGARVPRAIYSRPSAAEEKRGAP